MILGEPEAHSAIQTPKATQRDFHKFLAGFATTTFFYLFRAPNAFNTPTYSGSDAGVFNAIFYQLTLGRRLYRDIFEIKDPLFFYGYSIFRRWIGTSGPMIYETLIGVATIAILFRIAWRIGLRAGPATVCAFSYVLVYYNPAIYYPLHTYHQAVMFLLAAFALALEDRPLPAGAAYALAVLSKATLATFAPGVLVSVLFPLARRGAPTWRTRLGSFAIGGAVVAVGVICLLAARGELSGYVEAIRGNFDYTPLFSNALGWHNQPFQRIAEVLGWGLFTFFVAALAVVMAGLVRAAASARSQRNNTPVDDADKSVIGLFGAAAGSVLGCLLILRQAAWFNHYFASLAPAAFFTAAALPSALRQLQRPPLLAVIRWSSASLILVMVASGFASPKWAFSNREMLCPLRHQAPAHDPGFMSCLSGIAFPDGRPLLFATVGPNAGNTPVASTPPKFQLACRLFNQFPWFGPKLLTEFRRCLAEKPEIVFALPLLHFTAEEADSINSIVHSNYVLIGNCGEITIWQRKSKLAAGPH